MANDFTLLVLVLYNPDRLGELMAAWEGAGARGVTVLDSAGSQRRKKGDRRDDVPLFPSLRNFLEGELRRHYTVFTVTHTGEDVERLIAVTETVTGNLNQSATGILFTVPVGYVSGLVHGTPAPR